VHRAKRKADNMKSRILLFLLACGAAAVPTRPGEAGEKNAPDTKTAKAFREDCAAKAAAANTMTVAGWDSWLFLANELRHVGAGKFWDQDAQKVSRANRAETRDPLPAILDYKQRLERLGIELILVPVPPKAFIYPDKVSAAVKVGKADQPPRLDVYHQRFYRLLRDKGVKVIDLADDLLAHRLDNDGAMYCRTDTHWSGLACVRVAQRLAKELKCRPWMRDVPRLGFTSREEMVSVEGDLLRAMKQDARPAPEVLRLRIVEVKTDFGPQPVEPDRASPVLLLSDSHGLVFHTGGDMYTTGAGLADQLAMELGFPVDLLGVRGSGATPARVALYRRGRADPDYIARKKVIIWCFAAREFTETTGWSEVPVVKATQMKTEKQ